jgi:hypothetical protein
MERRGTPPLCAASLREGGEEQQDQTTPSRNPAPEKEAAQPRSRPARAQAKSVAVLAKLLGVLVCCEDADTGYPGLSVHTVCDLSPKVFLREMVPWYSSTYFDRNDTGNLSVFCFFLHFHRFTEITGFTETFCGLTRSWRTSPVLR